MSWVLKNGLNLKHVAMADIRARGEKEFPAKSMSEPRQRAKNIWDVCWTRMSSGNTDWSWTRERTEWQVKK